MFLPALVVLARRLGYDNVTGGAIGLVGAGAGFAGAFLNPFTVGVAQGIAGLPLFSGLRYRLLVWASSPGSRCSPSSSVRAPHRREPAAGPTSGRGEAHAPAAGGRSRRFSFSLSPPSSSAPSVWGWGIVELSALFVGVALLRASSEGSEPTAPRSGSSRARPPSPPAPSSSDSLAVCSSSSMALGVTDTILNALAGTVSGLPRSVSVLGIYLRPGPAQLLGAFRQRPGGAVDPDPRRRSPTSSA